ncbi:hypothetical protein GF319_09780 [Candidatus Bathyarchaeota archaeon]|nr:hypothetical protein [Candidatus Bathyarchaeota archaeon]
MVRETIGDLAESIRMIFREHRESKAVERAKHRVRAEFIMVGADRTLSREKRILLHSLEAELTAATTYDQFMQVIEKLNKIRDVEFPV